MRKPHGNIIRYNRGNFKRIAENISEKFHCIFPPPHVSKRIAQRMSGKQNAFIGGTNERRIPKYVIPSVAAPRAVLIL